MSMAMAWRSVGRPPGLAPLLLVLLCALMPTDMALAQADEARARFGQTDIPTAPVVVDGRVLLFLRGVSAYPAERRAAAVRERILQVAQDDTIPVNAITIQVMDDRSVIRANDVEVLTVFDVDAEVEAIPRHLLATVYREAVVEAVTKYRNDRSGSNLLRNGLFALGVTVLMFGLLWATRRLFHRLDEWSERHIRRSVRELASKSHYLLRAGTMWSVVAGVFRILRTAIVLALAYFYLNTVLGLFPWTRPIARTLFRLILNPLESLWAGFVSALPNLLFLLVLFFVVRYLLKLVRGFFTGVGHGRIKLASFDPDWAEPTYKIVRLVAIAFGLVIAYPYIPGSDSAAFKGVSVFLGVLLSLGSSSFIANMIAGLSMTYRGAFKEGDLVRVGDMVGIVEDVKLMVTRLRTHKNERVILPNSKILNSDVTNFSQLAGDQGVVVHTTVGIGYDTPWRQVEAMLLEAAARTEGLNADPPPFVLQSRLGDFAVNYEINAYTAEASGMPRLYSALHANIQDVFNEYGVQIMSPAYEADPAVPKIVPPDKWHEPPAVAPDSRPRTDPGPIEAK